MKTNILKQIIMKTKLFKTACCYSLLLLFVAMAMSCSKKDSPAPLPDDEAVAVQFSSNIGNLSPLIRPAAVGSSWENSDAIGVFMVNHGTTNVRGDATNRKYVTAAGNGTFAADGAGNTIYYPVNGDKVDFITYYPYQSSITTLGNYPVNVATQTTPAAIDLLYATANNSGSGYDKSNASAVALTFDHKLSKLTLNTSVAAGSTEIIAADLLTMTVTIAGMNTQASFNLAAGTLGAGSSKANITPKTVTAGAKYEAILLPENFTGVTVTFSISAGNGAGNYVWNVPNGTFEAGKDHVNAITFTDSGISVTGTINDWIVENGSGHTF
jgi:hypothetical protein